METVLKETFQTFTIINGSDSDFNELMRMVEKYHSHKDVIIYLQRNNRCLQYFRLVEKVYNVKKIQIIIINEEDVYYYQTTDENNNFYTIVNDVRERIESKIDDR